MGRGREDAGAVRVEEVISGQFDRIIVCLCVARLARINYQLPNLRCKRKQEIAYNYKESGFSLLLVSLYILFSFFATSEEINTESIISFVREQVRTIFGRRRLHIY